MAKKQIQSITEVKKFLSKEKLLPVFYLCGEDSYSIGQTLELIINAVTPSLFSDFDKEIFSAEKNQNLVQVLDLAHSFPFGGGKKLIIIKNFDRYTDKKIFVDYLKNPPEFTILVLTHCDKIADISKEPFASLYAKGFLFEARQEKGEELIEWVTKTAISLGLNFDYDNSQLLIEIAGEEKSLLNLQLDKLVNYLPANTKVSFEDIKKVSSATKEYSIFDLQDAIGKGNKAKAIEISLNLLNNGIEIVFIINMLAKFVITVAQITDLMKSNVSDNEGAKLANVSWGYYVNCKKAVFLMNDNRLLNASQALYNADLATKTTSADPKTTLMILITELLGKEVSSEL